MLILPTSLLWSSLNLFILTFEIIYTQLCISIHLILDAFLLCLDTLHIPLQYTLIPSETYKNSLRATSLNLVDEYHIPRTQSGRPPSISIRAIGMTSNYMINWYEMSKIIFFISDTSHYMHMQFSVLTMK